jgi:hypothetical protein
MEDINRNTGGAADFTGGANSRAGISGITGAGSSGALAGDWVTEEAYWRDAHSTRPYASADRGFDYSQPGYRYGYESAARYADREWTDAESDLRAGWDRYEHRGTSAWDNVKHAVRDAWDRVRGRSARP